ncbi:MAG: SH3 domain-containing protein [Acidimicrobiia bacterium]|nr:SH3 domain-containing protein [Acidimicrobiia bacterium]
MAPTTTIEPTTTVTYPWETHAVPATMRCVIGQAPGEDLNVRAGPSTDFDVIGTLDDDAAGFSTTGVGAADGQDREWLQIIHNDRSGWIAGWLVTQRECTISDPIDHCVIDTACNDRLNIRSGPGGDHQKIGSLAYDATGIHSTGWVSTDSSGRIWVQIEWNAGVGWVAGWFLSEEPCAPYSQPCSCPPDGTYIVLIHAVDVPGRMLDYDPVTWVWTGPADTEGYWENPDLQVLHFPIDDTATVMACPASNPLMCETPAFVAHSLGDLALWIANGTEIGQNQRFMSEIPGHTGQLWLIDMAGCQITEIRGRWVP